MKNFLLTIFTLLAFIAVSPAMAADKTSSPSSGASADCCLTNCTGCAKTCEETLAYCLKKGGKHAAPEHINILKDCIAMCKACSDLSSRNSPLAARLHALCAEACRKCAESCESLEDEKLAKCVEECKTCAKSCEEAAAK